MATSFVLTTGGPIIGSLIAESYFLRKHLSHIYEPSTLIPWIPKSFGGVVMFNVVASSVVVLVIGFKVGAARSSIKEKALKDG